MGQVKGELTINSNGIIKFRGKTTESPIHIITIEGNFGPRPFVPMRSREATFTFSNFYSLPGAHSVVTDNGVSFISPTEINIEAEPRRPEEANLKLNARCSTGLGKLLVLTTGTFFITVGS